MNKETNPVPEGYFGHPEFYRIIEELKELHSNKNHDYAGKENPLSNLTASIRTGTEPWKAVVIRLQDKMARLETFMRQETLCVKDETIEDVFKDMSVYSILGLILFRTGPYLEIKGDNK